MTVEQPTGRVRFVKSSFCSLGSCVEVGRMADGRVAVRDSKDPGGRVLIFDGAEWADFVAGVKAGEFDATA